MTRHRYSAKPKFAAIAFLAVAALCIAFAFWLHAACGNPESPWAQYPALQRIYLLLWGEPETSVNVNPLPAQRDPDSPLPLLRLRAPVNILWHERQRGTASFAEAGGYGLAELPMDIMGRGNSTWERGKRPYQIRFEEPVELLGMGAARKWILLACSLDKSLLRPQLAHRLAAYICSGWTPAMRPIELEINGVYQGVYLLAEKAEPGRNRLPLPEGAVFLRADMRAGPAEAFELPSGLRVAPESPGWNELSPAERESIQEFLYTVENALYEDAPGAWAQYFDLDALVDWFLVEELCNNVDAAMVASVYFTLLPEGKLRFGPVWDFDLCMANAGVQGLPAYEGWATALNGHGWFAELTQRPGFMDLVRARYAALAADGIYEEIDAWITEMAMQLKIPQKTNYQAWPIGMDLPLEPLFVSESWEEHVAYVREYFAKRRAWLEGELG